MSFRAAASWRWASRCVGWTSEYGVACACGFRDEADGLLIRIAASWRCARATDAVLGAACCKSCAPSHA